jgi:hypothetical protein
MVNHPLEPERYVGVGTMVKLNGAAPTDVMYHWKFPAPAGSGAPPVAHSNENEVNACTSHVPPVFGPNGP